ncbi:hypothetical protein LOK49_LG10G00966 [Camellia lanceoleosa]|uniref:Uncharacterized protein n=1 Tax=Camellia lanceoleosa TaxID=1840588 RepID=A0ACC0G8N8_9ERIC|nr:hypothetical protein LOK49_LG10G00966 [Camellia lanceoleosa]
MSWLLLSAVPCIRCCCLCALSALLLVAMSKYSLDVLFLVYGIGDKSATIDKSAMLVVLLLHFQSWFMGCWVLYSTAVKHRIFGLQTCIWAAHLFSANHRHMSIIFGRWKPDLHVMYLRICIAERAGLVEVDSDPAESGLLVAGGLFLVCFGQEMYFRICIAAAPGLVKVLLIEVFKNLSWAAGHVGSQNRSLLVLPLANKQQQTLS